MHSIPDITLYYKNFGEYSKKQAGFGKMWGLSAENNVSGAAIVVFRAPQWGFTLRLPRCRCDALADFSRLLWVQVYKTISNLEFSARIPV